MTSCSGAERTGGVGSVSRDDNITSDPDATTITTIVLDSDDDLLADRDDSLSEPEPIYFFGI